MARKPESVLQPHEKSDLRNCVHSHLEPEEDRAEEERKEEEEEEDDSDVEMDEDRLEPRSDDDDT